MTSFLQNILKLPTVLNAKLSPDRKWAAFVWYHKNENLDVFVVPTDGSRPPYPLSHTNEATTLVGWTADSSAVLVEEDHDRDERAALYKIDLAEPLKMTALTEEHPPFFLRSGGISPDGSAIFYAANFDFHEEEEIEPSYVYRQDLKTGGITALAKPAKAGWISPQLNKAGTYLIYSRKDRNPSGRQFYLVDVNGKKDSEILNFGDEYKIYARWLMDSENLVFTTESVDGTPQDHISLGLYNIHTREVKWLIDDPQRTIEAAYVSENGTIILDEVVSANHVCSFIDPQTLVETPAPTPPGNLLPLGKNAEGDWIGLYSAANSPTDLVRFGEDAEEASDLISLTNFWQDATLKAEELSAAESIAWASTDGEEIQGWLYRAIPNQKKAILYIHGGPTAHSENKMNPQIQYYVSRGFNVLDVNYRGSTGFGRRFKESIKEDGWGGREQDDIRQGAKKLMELDLAEPGAVGVTGTSYGGYSAWCQITRTHPDTIGASAPICGMTDLVVDYHTTRPDLRPYSEEMIGGTPAEIPQKYFERSPINFVENIRGDLLIIQGGRDPNVTPENAAEVQQKLDKHKIPYQIKIFEDEGHGIIRPTNQAVLYKLIADFFEKSFE